MRSAAGPIHSASCRPALNTEKGATTCYNSCRSGTRRAAHLAQCTHKKSPPACTPTRVHSSVPCPYGQHCSDTNDGSFERRVVLAYNVYLHMLCMIEPGKGMRFSSSVKHLHNMHLSAPSPQIQIGTTNTLDGLLINERALKTYTVFLHASCVSEISICMRLNYIV